MPVISLTEYITKLYGVIFENDDLVKIQKFKNFYDNENNILCIKALENFLGNFDIGLFGICWKYFFTRNK